MLLSKLQRNGMKSLNVLHGEFNVLHTELLPYQIYYCFQFHIHCFESKCLMQKLYFSCTPSNSEIYHATYPRFKMEQEIGISLEVEDWT